MPTRAGASDKAGNRYEYLWTVDHLLRILTDEVVSLTLEPLHQEESDGIEFIATMQDRTNEYWSIKRQTTASGWTLSALTSPNSTGRSILGDLFRHVRADDRNRAVFASTLGAGDFAELRELADDPALFEERLAELVNPIRGRQTFRYTADNTAPSNAVLSRECSPDTTSPEKHGRS